jgi:tetratricopeptide (TPR) repeat protein
MLNRKLQQLPRRRSIGTGLAVLLALALAACASGPEPLPAAPTELFADHLFGAPSEPVRASDIFAVSEPMRRYLRAELVRPERSANIQNALVEALYRGKLKLEYETAITRNAAQAFDMRAGNCLSLVIMTAALAKELGLQVRYQSAYLEENWSLKGNLLLRSGHVNITLGRPLVDYGVTPFPHELTIDFLPRDEIAGLKTRDIPESLVVAMYMNNRAVEALVDGRIDDAYAWSRASIVQNPGFLAAQNTLGVIYLRRDASAEAAAAFEHVLAREPDHTRALANLAEVRTRQGRTAEAERLWQQLARIESEPPLHYYRLGLAAMRREDYRAARDYFAREAARTDPPAELHYWLGMAHYRLGDVDQAATELARAAKASVNRSDRDLYSAKLAWLRNNRNAQ